MDFADIVAYQQAGDWQAAGDHLAQLAAGLEYAGADAILIATNTMHKVADHIARAVSVPLLHIGDVVADALLAAGVRRAGRHFCGPCSLPASSHRICWPAMCQVRSERRAKLML